MRKVILHIGPPKHGSSSIQQFFETHGNKLTNQVRYHFLSPNFVEELEADSERSIKKIKRILNSSHRHTSSIIFSQEHLYNNLNAIKNISKLLSANDRLIVIGYCRRQSSYIKSAYSQWIFRQKECNDKVNETLHSLKIPTYLFSGIEKYLIAQINADFLAQGISDDYNYHYRFTEIAKCVEQYGGIIKLSSFPTKKNSYNLIKKFLDSAEVQLTGDSSLFNDIRANIKFQDIYIEGFNNSMQYDLTYPSPHTNRVLNKLPQLTDHPQVINSKFLKKLFYYTDAFFWNDNRKLCKKYGLDENEFMPCENTSKQEIKVIINKEIKYRLENPYNVIDFYRQLCGKLASGYVENENVFKNKDKLLKKIIARIKIYLNPLNT